MITVRARSAAIGVCLLLVMAGCSREQQDWRSAEAADTIDSYGQFIQRHPDSELATQARARVAQLGEDRDWQHAGSADTVVAYRDFLAQHPNGKWAQEAHIRIENFSLGEQAGTDAGTKAASAAGPRPPGAVGSAGRAGGTARSYALAEPGDAATPAGTATFMGTPAQSAPGPQGLPLPQRAANGTAIAAANAAALSNLNSSATDTSTSIAPTSGTRTAVDPTMPPSTRNAHAPSALPPAGAAKTGFGIQLGAFSSESNATTQWRLLVSRYASELQGLEEHVVPATTGSGRIYRLQAMVSDEGRARAICDQLKKHGQACVAVLPH